MDAKKFESKSTCLISKGNIGLTSIILEENVATCSIRTHLNYSLRNTVL